MYSLSNSSLGIKVLDENSDLSEQSKIILRNNVKVQISKIENLNLKDFLSQLD